MPADSGDDIQTPSIEESQFVSTGLSLHDALTNTDAERAILACMMNDDSAWDRLTGLINETDFSDVKNRKIFRVIRALAIQNHHIDQISVQAALKDADLLASIGGRRYLLEVDTSLYDPRRLIDYKEMVRATTIRRALIQASDHIRSIATHPMDRTLPELLSESEGQVLQVGDQGDSDSLVSRLKDSIGPTIEYIRNIAEAGGRIPGLESGFRQLDELTSGFRDNDLIIVAARPGMGKTALTLNICTNILLNTSKPVLFFSLEQDREQLIRRMLASVAGVSYSKLDRGENLSTQDWQQLESARLSLSQREFFIVDQPNVNVDSMRSHIRRINRELKSAPSEESDAENLAMVVIDYLQLVRPSREYNSRVIELGEISRSLKALAKEFNIPVVSVAQLNRNLENRENKRPRMSDLRDSGEIEQDADLILFIYRDEVYDDQSAQKGKADIIISKHRNGPLGEITLDFQDYIMKFCNEGEVSYRAAVSYSSNSDQSDETDEADDPF